MADCFFLCYEIINFDITNSIVLNFAMLTLKKTILSVSRRKFEVWSFMFRERPGRFVMTIISFFSIFKVLSNNSNLYFVCSSPLSNSLDSI